MEDRRRRLSFLAENPREDLDVELKDWLDLNQREHQADLAKAMLALAYHGGGFVLVGYDDDIETPTVPSPEVAAQYDQDRVNGILQRGEQEHPDVALGQV